MLMQIQMPQIEFLLIFVTVVPSFDSDKAKTVRRLKESRTRQSTKSTSIANWNIALIDRLT